MQIYLVRAFHETECRIIRLPYGNRHFSFVTCICVLNAKLVQLLAHCRSVVIRHLLASLSYGQCGVQKSSVKTHVPPLPSSTQLLHMVQLPFASDGGFLIVWMSVMSHTFLPHIGHLSIATSSNSRQPPNSPLRRSCTYRDMSSFTTSLIISFGVSTNGFGSYHGSQNSHVRSFALSVILGSPPCLLPGIS